MTVHEKSWHLWLQEKQRPLKCTVKDVLYYYVSYTITQNQYIHLYIYIKLLLIIYWLWHATSKCFSRKKTLAVENRHDACRYSKKYRTKGLSETQRIGGGEDSDGFRLLSYVVIPKQWTGGNFKMYWNMIFNIFIFWFKHQRYQLFFFTCLFLVSFATCPLLATCLCCSILK